MGADIHAYAEYRGKGTTYWHGFGCRNGLSRNYRIFGKLAGVRGDECVIPPRGIPNDLGFWAKGDWWLYISDHKDADGWEGFTTPENAERYGQHGSKFLTNDDGSKRAVECPDWHTPSWLTGEEWRSIVADLEWAHEYRALGAALAQLESEGMDTRVVFWFDS